MDVSFIMMYMISAIFTCFFSICCWCKLTAIPIPWKNIKFYFVLGVMSIVIALINEILPHYFKMIVVILLLYLANYFFFNRSLAKSVVTVMISELIIMFSELIVVFMFTLLFNDFSSIQYNFWSVLLTNLGVVIIGCVLLKTPLPYKLYDMSIKVIDGVKNNDLIAILVLTICLATVLMVMSWMELPKVIVLSINTVLILLYLIIIVALLYTTQKYKKIYSKYEISLNSLREYEKMMDKYRVANHENKNQLLTIRNMIKTSDQKSLKYVDKIIDNQNKDDQAIFCKTAKIPEGGLRATIYSEICKMNDLKINYSLDISNELKTADFINISDDTMINICKIMGVFLDNAIEEVQKLPKKRQNIIIEIFIQDNELIIDISNNYDNVIEIDKMSSKKYTTKGEGHGYGLSLVEDIVKNDNNIINEKFISKEKFTQRVIINI